MLPTIQIGDHIFVNKLAYAVRLPLIGTEVFSLREPARGDVVVFVRPDDPGTDLIKRVVAVAGDTVEIRDKLLFVNGEPVSESHAQFTDAAVIQNGPRDNLGPVVVPEGMFFVLGDNRDRSYDSRFWGFANVAAIKGKAMFVYFSWDSSQGWLYALRFDRLGHFIE